MGLLTRVLVNALAIFLVAGIEIHGVVSVLAAGLVLGAINAVVRPILLILTFPFTLVTLGLFIFVLNAFCFWLTSVFVRGFEVSGFWSALFGALLVSLVSWVLTAFVSDRGHVEVITSR